MSVYFEKGKGYRYDFEHKKKRFTSKYYQTKKETKQAELKKREELLNTQKLEEEGCTAKVMQQESKTQLAAEIQTELAAKIQTDTGFLDLVNERLDHLKAYRSMKHYQDTLYSAQGWIEEWGHLNGKEISPKMIRNYLLKKREVSAFVANKELRYLRSAFNFWIHEDLITENPTQRLSFFPVDKKIRYVPMPDEIDKVIQVADPESQDYLWVIRETMGRVSEVNRLRWDDVNFAQRYVVLYTSKKRGGDYTPRKVPMTTRVHDILHRRFLQRDHSKPWVFWHRYYSRKSGKWEDGPYQDRKKIMKSLCAKAHVKYFRFHALRHSGASIMDNNNVPVGAIQAILGHENRSTTEIYLHTLGDSAREAMVIYERAREKSHVNPHVEPSTNKNELPAKSCNSLIRLEPAMGFEPATC